MKAKSIKGKSSIEIQTALNQSLEDGFKPTLAIVFISDENEVEAARKILSEKKLQIFGSSAHAPFTDGNFGDSPIVIMLLDLNPSFFKLLLIQNSGSSLAAAEQIGKAGLSAFTKPSFLIGSGGLIADGDEIIAGIQNVAGKDCALFGGLASDNLKMERTYVFTNDELTDSGILALIMDAKKVLITGAAIGGWKPVGNDRIITKSKGNIVYTIDHEPAFDFIARYSGLKKSDLQTDSPIAIALSSNFQLLLQRPNLHSVMRTPMYVNKEDSSIVFGGGLPEGSKVRLCLMPGFDVTETTVKGFSEFKNQQPEADALIMFSCAGRQVSIGPYLADEIDGIKKIWDVPMTGFFCYGEIGRVAGGNNEFHAMTCSLALLKER